ncbi:MAG: hypothetical protein IKU61_00855, partial [Clostridia bacterium]|nr:hypothetical protein [Clostridia bacterium]
VSGLGEWGVGGGQFFNEFSSNDHIVDDFVLPKGARIYRTIDYGLDALACLFISVDTLGRATVFKEVYESDLIVSAAAKAIRDATGDLDIYCTFAPPDLWARQKDSGKSIDMLFAEHGVPLTASDNSRASGWMALKEWLKPVRDENGDSRPRMRISSSCENLIRCLPSLVGDKKRVGDCLTEPHEITHLPDALRYFAVMQTRAPQSKETLKISDFTGKNRRKNRF